jgi:hypothetical protein
MVLEFWSAALAVTVGVGGVGDASRTARKPPRPAAARHPTQRAAKTSLFMPMM